MVWNVTKRAVGVEVNKQVRSLGWLGFTHRVKCRPTRPDCSKGEQLQAIHPPQQDPWQVAVERDAAVPTDSPIAVPCMWLALEILPGSWSGQTCWGLAG